MQKPRKVQNNKVDFEKEKKKDLQRGKRKGLEMSVNESGERPLAWKFWGQVYLLSFFNPYDTLLMKALSTDF